MWYDNDLSILMWIESLLLEAFYSPDRLALLQWSVEQQETLRATFTKPKPIDAVAGELSAFCSKQYALGREVLMTHEFVTFASHKKKKKRNKRRNKQTKKHNGQFIVFEMIKYRYNILYCI